MKQSFRVGLNKRLEKSCLKSGLVRVSDIHYMVFLDRLYYLNLWTRLIQFEAENQILAFKKFMCTIKQNISSMYLIAVSNP